MSEIPNPGLRSLDERYRAAGLALIMRLLKLIRVGRSYQVGNSVFHQQAESFLEALAPVFLDTSEVTFVVLDNDFYLNGVRVTVQVKHLRYHQILHEEFRRRRIAGIRFQSGVMPGDIERFFQFFLEPDTYHGPVLLEACMADGLTRVLPAVYASTEEIVEPATSDEPAEEMSWGDEATTAPNPNKVGPTPPGWSVGPGPAGGERQGRRTFSLATMGARSLLMSTTLQDGVELRHAKRVVQPLVDGAFRDEPVLVGLSTLSHHDEYTYAHCVNVCIVSVSMGHHLGLDRRSLAEIGVAALLHDVGKADVAGEIHNALEHFTEAERAAAERHPVSGARLIARSTLLNPTTVRCLRAAFEHHMGGARGYPAIDGWKPGMMSRIIQVADCYVSLLMHRGERAGMVTPYEVLGMMLGPLAGRFEPALLWGLVQTVGLYPPGQLVELSDGTLAVVLAPNRRNLERPSVRVIMDAGGVPFALVESLARQYDPLPPHLFVKRALRMNEYPQLPPELLAA